MKSKKSLLVGLLIVLMLTIWGGCVSVQEGGGPSGKASADQTDQAQKDAQAPGECPAPNVYNLAVESLNTLDCARCHISVFTDIRDNGGKHQLQCRDCHKTFHTSKPGMAWADVVPKCKDCHGEIHGQDFAHCMSCHQDAHMPIKTMVNADILSKDCNSCHDKQGAEVIQHQSAHTDVACNECHHTEHGKIPACTECHPEPHADYEDNDSCRTCHPAHSPLDINYGKEVANSICFQCHAETARKLTDSTRKHSTLKCVFCHADRHRHVLKCENCHEAPHSEAMLKKFNDCQECHGEPHALILPGK
jgi:predicted CXXCH cytochrome family protein